MYILVTNDDGIRSPGLLALKQSLSQLGEVAVIAPERNWSAGSHSRTFFSPLRGTPMPLADGSDAIACDGTPADCVALGVMGLLPRRPDLVVSGINLGANLGHDVLYSGTVAAAMEGIIKGIPSIAVSLVDGFRPDADFSAAATWTRRIVQSMLQHDIPSSLLLNINVPLAPAETIREVHVTRLGTRIYRDELVVRHDPRGRPYYWVGGDHPTGLTDEGTDLGAIHAGHVSITPLHFNLTSDTWIERLQSITWNTDIESGHVTL